MAKLSSYVFILVAPVLMGILATAVLATPSLMDQGPKMLAGAAAVGFLLAFPVTFFVAKSLQPKPKSKG